MAEITMISENRLRYLSGLNGLNIIYMEKDYFLTILLYLLKDTEGICFKGGTALNKIFLNHARLSEDLDFTCQKDVSIIKKRIVKILKGNKSIFPKYGFENQTRGFFRLKVFYKSFFEKSSYIILDMNGKASIVLEPKKQKVSHFYDDLPDFGILTLDVRELMAEKIRTLVTRNQPRDYFDVYNMLEKGHKINLRLARRKVEESGQKFDIERIFKGTQKVYSRWHEISQLTNRPVEFMTVIKRLKREFGYKT